MLIEVGEDAGRDLRIAGATARLPAPSGGECRRFARSEALTRQQPWLKFQQSGDRQSHDVQVVTLDPRYEGRALALDRVGDRKSTRLNSSHDQISYAVFCLKKKNDRASRCI